MLPPKRGIITRKSASASPTLAFRDSDLVLLEDFRERSRGRSSRAFIIGAGSTEFYAVGIRPALQRLRFTSLAVRRNWRTCLSLTQVNQQFSRSRFFP